MTTTINGRTLEEIKRGLGYCCPKWESDHWVTCRDECPFKNEGIFCRNVLAACALALFYRFEHEYDELLQKNQQLERERDAAVEQLRKGGRACSTCKFSEDIPENDKICEECRLTGTKLLYSNWEWVGPQEVE